MTVSSTISANTYVGTGTTGPFAYNFRIFAATDLVVQKTDALGAVTVLAYPTDFTVTGVGNISGGSITLVAALAVGVSLSIRRVRPLTQLVNFRDQQRLSPVAIENALDNLTMIVQQQQRTLDLVPGLGVPTTIPAEGRVTASLSQYLVNNRRYNVLDYGAVGDGFTNDTTAFENCIAAARAGKGCVYVPRTAANEYIITRELILGNGTLAWVGLEGEQGAGLTIAPALVWAGGNGFVLNISGPNIGTLSYCGVIRNIRLRNNSTTLLHGCIKAHFTALLVLENVMIYTQGIGIDCNETISAACYGVYITGNPTAKYGIRGFKRNFTYYSGRVYGCEIGIELSGESHVFHGTNIEFCTVALRSGAITTALMNGIHVESCVMLLTNAETIPLVAAGGANWVDNASLGIAVAGGVKFLNSHIALAGYSSQTNFVVIKNNAAGFIYELQFDNCYVSHDRLKITSSFDQASAAAVPSGSLIKLYGRMAGNIAVSVPVDAFSLLVREDDNQLYMQRLSAEVVFASALISGNAPAVAGAIRMTNNTGLNWRNNGNTADVAVLYTTGGQTHIGSEGTVVIDGPGVDGDVLNLLSTGNNTGLHIRNAAAGGLDYSFQSTGGISGYGQGKLLIVSGAGTGTARHAAFDLSATADDTRLLLWDVTAGALVRVSRGAADSGGAGFRLLRIPN